MQAEDNQDIPLYYRGGRFRKQIRYSIPFLFAPSLNKACSILISLMNTDSYKAIKAKLTQKMGIYWMLGVKDRLFQKS